MSLLSFLVLLPSTHVRYTKTWSSLDAPVMETSKDTHHVFVGHELSDRLLGSVGSAVITTIAS